MKHKRSLDCKNRKKWTGFFHLDTLVSSELNARNSKSEQRKTKQRKPNQFKFVIHMTRDEYETRGPLNLTSCQSQGAAPLRSSRKGTEFHCVVKKGAPYGVPCRSLGAVLHGGSNDPAHFPATCAKRFFSVAWRSMSQCLHIPLIRNQSNPGQALGV